MGGQYNWVNRCGLWLDMRHRSHDPVNLLSVNRGTAGPALDAEFGAGAAEPAKLVDRHGYAYDGGDHMLVADDASNRFGTGDFSVMAFFTATFTAGVRTLIAKGTVGNAGEWLLYIYSAAGSWNIRFYGDSGAINAIHNIGTANPHGAHTVAFVRTGDDGVFYYDGSPETTIGGIGAIDLNTTKDVSVGAADEGGERWFIGNIYQEGLDNVALTPSQMAQFDREAREGAHLI